MVLNYNNKNIGIINNNKKKKTLPSSVVLTRICYKNNTLLTFILYYWVKPQKDRISRNFDSN